MVDEREAIDRCLAGDKDGFATIVALYQAQVLALCLRMTGNREDAADVAQQTFVTIYRHLDRYDPDQPFRPWLYRIATNECIGFLRRHRRHAERAGPTDALDQLADPDHGPQALADLAVDRERVRQAVAELPLPYRTVVVLYYFQEQSYQQIAQQTGLAIGTISTQLHRAKRLLKERLTAEEVSPGEPHRARATTAVLGRRG